MDPTDMQQRVCSPQGRKSLVDVAEIVAEIDASSSRHASKGRALGVALITEIWEAPM